MKLLFFLFTFLLSNFLFSQQSKIDSLLTLLKKDKEDTNKVIHLNKLSWEYELTGNFEKGLSYGNEALQLAHKLNFKKGIASSYNNIGIVYWNQGDYPKALDYCFKALKMAEDLGYKELQANTLGNIGNIYRNQGNYPEGLKNYFASLKIREAMGNKKGIASSYNNIGIIYYSQGNYPEALKKYFASLKIREAIGDKKGIADSYNNIGIIYRLQGNYPESLKNYFASLKIKEAIGDKQGIAYSYNNIGIIYRLQGNYPQALKNQFACLKIMEAIGDKQGIATSYINIGSVQLKRNNIAEAKKYYGNALALSKEIGSKDDIKESYSGLAETDSAQGNYKSAYQNYKMYIIYRDSLINEENTKKTVQAQMQYEFDKKESLAKAEQEKKDAIVEEEKRRQKIVIWSMIVVLLLIVVFSVFMFNRWRVTKKQKKIIEVQKTEVEKSKELIEDQKKLVEEKNKDITDSINYAQRIQKALLASDSLLTPALKGEFARNYFILFKPKDIVSGDFYWATKVLSNGEDLGGARFYLAVCDSTGHGVPGAFMSLLNISFLNEAINEEELVHPNEIFNHVRQRLIENISSEGAKDGMDGILLKFQVPTYKSKVPSEQPSVIIEYAASNNAPILINSSFQELDCDNMPVGISDRKNSFTLHAVPLPNGKGSGDGLGVLYLFTDGFADQFGGPKDKKFKTKLLKQKLMEISHLQMEEQKKVLEQTFNEWKGSREQTDDVLVVGIKI